MLNISTFYFILLSFCVRKSCPKTTIAFILKMFYYQPIFTCLFGVCVCVHAMANSADVNG